jgi:hypothetical protein
LKADYPYLTTKRIEAIVKCSKKKTMRGVRNELKQANDEFEQMSNELPVKKIEIDIEWKRNQTWGYNPHATAWAQYSDGHWEQATATCSGCGYDKKSTVVADVMNQLCRGMLWRSRRRAKKAPYGVYYSECGYLPHFDGGIGMSSYREIANYLGGKMEQVANTSTYDKFIFTF